MASRAVPTQPALQFPTTWARRSAVNATMNDPWPPLPTLRSLSRRQGVDGRDKHGHDDGAYIVNTNNIDAVALLRNSGALPSTCSRIAEPASTATYCLPLIAKVIGGALMPVPMLKFHTSSKVFAS